MIKIDKTARRNASIPLTFALIAALAWGGACRAKSPAFIGRGELRFGIDKTSGLPAGIETGTAAKRRAWLSGPVALAVREVSSRRGERVASGSVSFDAETAESTANLASLGLTVSGRLRVDGAKAVWDLTFSGEGKRTEHEIRLDFPALFPGARIFTPSQYGVMDADAYPTFQPVAYATYGWTDGQSYVLPLVSIMDPAGDTALTVALPADENIPHLQVSWSDARTLTLRLARRGLGGGRPTRVRLLFYTHPADYRCALKAYAGDFPSYFRPPLPRGPYEGTFWYHHILDHPDFAEMARQRVRYIWSAFWFTHMGEFLPAAREWFPFTYAREWNLMETMTDAKINAFIRTMHDRGIGTYAYFNVTEFGGRGGREGTSAEADKILAGPLADSLVRDARGRAVPTWERSKVLNPNRTGSFRPFLEEQMRRHVARLPGFDGFMVDRLDWASGFDYARGDGLSMDGERGIENLAVPVGETVRELCRVAHDAGKRVFVNQFWRVELLRDTDGYCHENDYLPALGYLSPLRPASAWHERRPYAEPADRPAFEGQMKRRLIWALFPQMIAHEFPISQQAPNAWAADVMELFAPLFEPLLGKEQVLLPHCADVSGANETNLFRNGAGNYVAPVTSRVRFLCRPAAGAERVELTLRVPDAGDLGWAHVYSADGPPYRVPVAMKAGAAVIQIERHISSSVVVAGKSPEPPFEDKEDPRLGAIRARLFPSPAARRDTSAKPVIEDAVDFELRIKAASIGSSGPAAVTTIFVDDRKAGWIKDAAGDFRVFLPLERLPENPPSVGLLPGDEGTWLAPEKAELVVRTKTGRAWLAASWNYGDPCGAEGVRGIRLPLRWREPVRVE